MSGKINDNIKSIRELKNYTQHYMAFRLGITQAGYSKIERGDNAIGLDKLEQIASVFEMNINTIIEFDTSVYLEQASKSREASQRCGIYNLDALYKDKILLLEKLLAKTDWELKKYKDKFGCL